MDRDPDLHIWIIIDVCSDLLCNTYKSLALSAALLTSSTVAGKWIGSISSTFKYVDIRFKNFFLTSFSHSLPRYVKCCVQFTPKALRFFRATGSHAKSTYRRAWLRWTQHFAWRRVLGGTFWWARFCRREFYLYFWRKLGGATRANQPLSCSARHPCPAVVESEQDGGHTHCGLRATGAL